MLNQAVGLPLDWHGLLFSLFGSRAAQGLNPFFHCLAVLAQPNPLG